MRPFRHARLQRFVASFLLAALAVALAPAALARPDAVRSAREVRLDAVLDHPGAVRAALLVSDAAVTPEGAVGLFLEAYRAATGETAPPEAVADVEAELVADLFLGRAFRPVPPPETKISAAGASAASLGASACVGDGLATARALPVASLPPSPPAPAPGPTDTSRTSPSRAP